MFCDIKYNIMKLTRSYTLSLFVLIAGSNSCFAQQEKISIQFNTADKPVLYAGNEIKKAAMEKSMQYEYHPH